MATAIVNGKELVRVRSVRKIDCPQLGTYNANEEFGATEDLVKRAEIKGLVVRVDRDDDEVELFVGEAVTPKKKIKRMPRSEYEAREKGAKARAR